jgi:phytoene synthase
MKTYTFEAYGKTFTADAERVLDVMEDAKNNRFYIAKNFDSIRNTLKLADLFYESSFASIKKIPINFRFSILVARRVYRKIGHNILKKKNFENYNNAGKIYVTNIGKISQTILSIYDLMKLSLMKPGEHLRDKEHLVINEEINLNERV